MKITVLLAALAVLTIAGGPPILPSVARSTFARSAPESPAPATPSDVVAIGNDAELAAGKLPDGHSACPHRACAR